MLELTTKWFTNSLAKQSMLNNDFILCNNGARLFIVGYGNLTSSGKNTYNYEVKDNEKNIVLSMGKNAYLDALTKIVLGSSPKSKEGKKKSEEANGAKQTTKKANNESLLLTFDEAFAKACKLIEGYKEASRILGKYKESDTSTLTLLLIKKAKESEAKRIKDAKKGEELKSLRQTLELAKLQGNNMLVDAINEMIAKKEKE